MWFSILKADTIGNWTRMFLGLQPYPTDDDIKSLDEKTASSVARNLDTTINKIEQEFEELTDEEPALKNAAAQRVFGTRKVEGLGVDGAKKELETLKSYRDKFEVKTTSQSEVKEQLQPLIDTAEQSKSFDDIMEVWKYINSITDGKWGSASQMWMRKLGNIVSTTDNFASVINANLAAKDNYGYVEQVAKILGWGLKGERETIQVAGGKKDKLIDAEKEKDNPAFSEKRKKKGELVQTSKKRRRTKPGTLQATRKDKLLDEAVPHQNIELKIQNMKSLIKFRKFMNILHTSGATNNTVIEPFKGQGVDILHDVAIVAQRKLDDTVKLVDYGRKGLSLTHRQSPYKLEFAEYYLNKELSRTTGPFKMGKWELDPDIDQMERKERKEQKQQRIGAIGWIQEMIREKRGEVYDEFKEYVKGASKARVDARNRLNQAKDETDGQVSQEIINEVKEIYKNRGIPLGEGSLDFYLGRGDGTLNLNNAITSFNIPEDKTFLATMWAWLFKQYSEIDTASEFEALVMELSTAENWTNYIPSGRNFDSIGNESFIKTMKAILSLINLFYGNQVLDNYNSAIKRISKRFYITMEESNDFIEEEEGEDDPDVLLELIIEGYLETEKPEYHESLLGCRQHLDTIIRELNQLLLELDDKVHTELHEICIEIGKDREGVYAKNTIDLSGQPASAKEHLIKMGLLQKITGDEEE